MSINIHNYEAYLLDYYEDSLSENEKAELIAFVLAHPEFKIELEENLQYLSSDDTSFSLDKNKLKSIAAPTEDEYISYIENQFTEEEKIDFKNIITSNKEYQRQLSSWEKTILITPEVNFPKKRSLKHYSISPVIYTIVSAAAIVVFMFTLFNNYEERQYNNNGRINTYIQLANTIDNNEQNFNTVQKNQEPKVEKQNSTPSKLLISQKLPQDQDTATIPTDEPYSNDDFIPNIALQANEAVNDNKISIDSLSEFIQPKQDINTESDIALEEKTIKKDSYTVKEWVVNKLQEKEILDSTENDPTLLEIAANTIGEFDSKETDNEKVTLFKIGKFEYYRKKSKHL